MNLDEDQIKRYARHILLREVGGEGQAKLLDSKVLVIGAGGLGSPVLLYLAAAGIGTIGVIDDDTVDLSNLQRQVVHATESIGKPKVESAGKTTEGYVLYTYAAIQAWAEAVKSAGSTDFDAVVGALNEGNFSTVLGDLSFDDKGDVSLPGYVMYEWHDGKYSQM